jgi:hypothetical protein
MFMVQKMKKFMDENLEPFFFPVDDDFIRRIACIDVRGSEYFTFGVKLFSRS